MRLFKFLLTGVLFAATAAHAQVNSTTLLMPAAADPTAAVSAAEAPDPAAALPAAPVTSADAAPAALSVSATPAPSPAEPSSQRGTGNVSVFENYNFQASVGYTFLRFYEAPHQIQNRNGFNSNLVYYYHGGWLGVDGSLLGGFGSQGSQRSRFLFAGAGPRFRWAGERAIEFWGHGLVGGSHYTPQTIYGSQGAFGYELGGGVDA